MSLYFQAVFILTCTGSAESAGGSTWFCLFLIGCFLSVRLRLTVRVYGFLLEGFVLKLYPALPEFTLLFIYLFIDYLFIMFLLPWVFVDLV